jgi:hypothetical protein
MEIRVGSWNNPTFNGLLDLAQRDGVDIRPTLLRVITDSYIQSATHSPSDERQYSELALRLLGETDIPGRASVAARLAEYPLAPRAVIQDLARDVLEVAEPILRHSPCLTPEDCEAIIAECGPFYAEILAQRRGASGRASKVDGASAPRAGGSKASDLCELFFAAGEPERRLILLNLDYAATDAFELPSVMRRTDIWRLELAALRHQSDAVVRELETALGVSNRQAKRIVNDELGEPIVVAAKAMNLPADVLQRVLLFLNPQVGQSVDRVYSLSALYNEISVDSARRLVAIWRDADPVGRRPTRPLPTTWDQTVESARWALSEISRQSIPRKPGQDSATPRRGASVGH